MEPSRLVEWLEAAVVHTPGFASPGQARSILTAVKELAAEHIKLAETGDAKAVTLLIEYFGEELVNAVLQRDRARSQIQLAKQVQPSLPGGSAGDPTANHVSATVAGGLTSLTPDDWHREYDRLEQIASEERERADSHAHAIRRLQAENETLRTEVATLTRQLAEKANSIGSTDTPPATLAHLEQRLEMFAGTFNLSCKAAKEMDDYTRAAIAELRGVCRDLGDRITAIEKTIPFEPIKRRV